MRDTSVRLCEAFNRAEYESFEEWCDLFGKRKEPAPATVIASQAALHETAWQLREWCLADPAAAEAERQELMVRQVEGELAAEAAVRARRSAEDRERIRRDWITAQRSIICQRDALTCGLGWPHRGEQVTASTWYYDADGTKVSVAGDGIYLGSYDVFNVSHEVWLPTVSARRREGTLLVWWSAGAAEDLPLGPPDPAGDIGLRLTGMPVHRLPVPLMRWPGPADAGIEVSPPGALFSVTGMPRTPAGQRELSARRLRVQRKASSTHDDGHPALF